MANFTDPYDDIGIGGSGGTQYMVLKGDPFLPPDQRQYGQGTFFFNTKNPDGSSIVARPTQGTYCKTGCARGSTSAPTGHKATICLFERLQDS